VACGSTKSGSKAVTRPVTRTATPAERSPGEVDTGMIKHSSRRSKVVPPCR
jgi:hypothetical protein